jgi:hypothetical protein
LSFFVRDKCQIRMVHYTLLFRINYLAQNSSAKVLELCRNEILFLRFILTRRLNSSVPLMFL